MKRINGFAVLLHLALGASCTAPQNTGSDSGDSGAGPDPTTTPPTAPPNESPSPRVLRTRDLSCAGMFLTPGVPLGGLTTAYPVAMRHEAGKRHYLIYSGSGNVYEFPEPDALSPCSSDF